MKNGNNTNSRNILDVINLYKTFKIPKEKKSTLKERIASLTFRTKYNALELYKNISFSQKKGEWIGLVGRNGCGKSTLLKIISGIYKQDKGIINANGSIIPFIGLGVGFDSELTVRENIYLNGTINGLEPSYIEKVFKEIVGFAELQDFVEVRLKNLSSGMKARLGFAIASYSDGDLYLIDEILSVGDFAFRKKCDNLFERLKNENKSAILVSHSEPAIRNWCDRCLVLNEGNLIFDGDVDEAFKVYNDLDISIHKLEKTNFQDKLSSEDNIDFPLKTVYESVIGWSNKAPDVLQIEFKDNKLIGEVNSADSPAYLITGFGNFDNPPSKYETKLNYLISPEDTYSFKIDAKWDDDIHIATFFIGYNETKKVFNDRFNLERNKNKIYPVKKLPNNMSQFRLALRFNGKGKFTINKIKLLKNIPAEEIEKINLQEEKKRPQYNLEEELSEYKIANLPLKKIDECTFGWGNTRLLHKFFKVEYKESTIEGTLNLRDNDKAYLYTGYGSFNDPPSISDNDIINYPIENNQSYEITFDIEKDDGIIYYPVFIEYDDFNRINKTDIYHIDNKKNINNIKFKTNKNAIQFRIALRFSGKGKFKINNISFRKLKFDETIDNREIFDLKKELESKNHVNLPLKKLTECTFGWRWTQQSYFEVNFNDNDITVKIDSNLFNSGGYLYTGDEENFSKPVKLVDNINYYPIDVNKKYRIKPIFEKQGSIYFYLFFEQYNDIIGNRVDMVLIENENDDLYVDSIKQDSTSFRIFMSFMGKGIIKINQIIFSVE